MRFVIGKLAIGQVCFQEVRFLRSVIIPPILRNYILTEAQRLDPSGAAVQNEIAIFQFFKIKKKKYLRRFSFDSRRHINYVRLYETAWVATSMDFRNG